METVIQQTQTRGGKPSLLGMLVSPRQQFKYIEVFAPILLPLLIISFVSAVCAFLIAINSPDHTAIQEVAKALNTAPERVQIVTGVVASFSSFITLIFNFVITTILLKILLAFFYKSINFKTILSLNIHIGIISVLFTIFNLVFNLAVPHTEFISYTNLSLLSSKGTLLYSILKTFDIAPLWTILLTAIGLYDLAKLSKKQAGTFAVIVLLLNFVMNYFTNL